MTQSPESLHFGGVQVVSRKCSILLGVQSAPRQPLLCFSHCKHCNCSHFWFHACKTSSSNCDFEGLCNISLVKTFPHPPGGCCTKCRQTPTPLQSKQCWGSFCCPSSSFPYLFKWQRLGHHNASVREPLHYIILAMFLPETSLGSLHKLPAGKNPF